jgi:hypothetical protein
MYANPAIILAPSIAGSLSMLIPNRGMIRMKDIDRTAGRFDIDRAGHGRGVGRLGRCREDVMTLLWRCLVEAGARATERARRVARRRPLIGVVVDTL